MNNNQAEANTLEYIGLIATAKPVLTVASLPPPKDITHSNKFCYVCNQETTKKDLHVGLISVHYDCKNQLKCVICKALIRKKFCIHNGLLMHPKCFSSVLTRRCVTCAIPITNSELIRWQGLIFHDNCFKCAICHQHISTKEGTHVTNGLPICQLCYKQKAHICLMCNESVALEKDCKYLSRGKAYYIHKACAVCNECNGKLTKENFVFEQNTAICKQCWHKSLTRECNECHEPVLSRNLMSFHGCWHNECIKCIKCHQSLKFAEVRIMKNQMFCCECFEGMKNHCGACGQFVDKDFIVIHDLPFHYQCLNCCNCQCNVTATNSEYISGKLYCSTCTPLK